MIFVMVVAVELVFAAVVAVCYLNYDAICFV